MGVRCRYLVLHHEATLANLLEVALFHREACEAAGEDALLEVRPHAHPPRTRCASLGEQWPRGTEAAPAVSRWLPLALVRPGLLLVAPCSPRPPSGIDRGQIPAIN